MTALVDQLKGGLDAPICLTWELTYACNLQCVHCLSSSGRRDPEELTTAEAKAVLDEAALRTLVEDRLGNDEGRPLLLLVLDGVQDPHNLGACMRTADAAGADAIVAPRHGAAGLGPTVSKVAAGAAETLPFAQVGNIGKTLDWLGDYGVVRVGTSDRGSGSVYDTNLTGPIAIVMGREEKGITRSVLDRCDQVTSLPMLGEVSSLNVSVATGICLYEALRQRRADEQATGEGS